MRLGDLPLKLRQAVFNVPTGTFNLFRRYAPYGKPDLNVPTGTVDTFCTQFNFQMVIRPCI